MLNGVCQNKESEMARFGRLGLSVFLFFGLAPATFAQSIFDQIGLTALRDRLGGAAPTGAGIPVMQGEALVAPNAYLPDPSDSQFTGKTFTDHSGGGVV